MTEQDFIQAIIKDPHDDILRLVYADWLEDRGDRKGSFLRAEVALVSASANNNPFQGELLSQLQVSGQDVAPGWVAAMSRIPIENCREKFRCPKRWEDLETMSDEEVRFCDVCRKQVFFCHRISVAQTHAAIRECIVVDPRLVRQPGDLESDFLGF